MESGYDRFYAGTLGPALFVDIPVRTWPRGRIEAIVSVPGGGDTIVDIGCGNGGLLFQYRSRFLHLVGIEFSPERLRQATVNLAGLDATLHQGSAEAMGQIPTDSVDRIVISDVIEHIPDVYLATEEMYRVIKPGGTLIVNTPNAAYVKRRVQLLAGRFPSTSQKNEGLGSDVLFDGGHLHYFTFRSLRLLLERSGFRVIAQTGYGRFGRLHAAHPPLTSVGVQLVAQKPPMIPASPVDVG